MEKLKLPGLLGMMIAGVVLGPYGLNLLSPAILEHSAEIKIIALTIIFMRAGLALDLKDLKKIGRPAALMSCIPAIFEIIAIVLLAPLLLPISYLEAAILGTILAATSPAIIIPRMLKAMENGYGKTKSIPQLIMTGASVNGIFVIVLLTSFIGMYQGEGFNAVSLLNFPIAIVTGLILGVVTGIFLAKFFEKNQIADTVKVFIVLGIAFLLVSLDSQINQYVPFSGLLAVMALGVAILYKNEHIAKHLSSKYSKIWVFAEVFLFVLLGASISITHIHNVGLEAALLIAFALVLRMVGVFACLLKANLEAKEKLFCAIAYLPKATVQAAIGSIPLAAGVAAGHTILVIAVLAIIITAPFGAMGIDKSYKKLLTKE
jgi:NhaP-type Na+/H+ or K+/H+ antiporter